MFKPGEGEKRADFKKWVGTGGGLEQPVGWGARVWGPEPASQAGLELGEKPARAEKAWQAGLEKKPSWTPGWPSPSVPSGSLPASQALLACQLGGKPSSRMLGQLMGDNSPLKPKAYQQFRIGSESANARNLNFLEKG